MFAGIGVFGVFIALIASLFVRPSKDHASMERIVERLNRIEAIVSTLAAHTSTNETSGDLASRAQQRSERGHLN
jgi:hypothetical protein